MKLKQQNHFKRFVVNVKANFIRLAVWLLLAWG